MKLSENEKTQLVYSVINLKQKTKNLTTADYRIAAVVSFVYLAAFNLTAENLYRIAAIEKTSCERLNAVTAAVANCSFIGCAYMSDVTI